MFTSVHLLYITHLSPKGLEAEGGNLDENKSDVFLLCKHYMHSTRLTRNQPCCCQPTAFPGLALLPLSTCPGTHSVNANFRSSGKTARQIALAPWNLIRASNYLVELCDSNESKRTFEAPQLVSLWKVLRH